MSTYPNANLWSTAHHVEIRTVNPTKDAAANGSRTLIITMEQQTHIFDKNLQKELLSEYKQDSKNKSLEYSKFLVNKNALIMIIFGQCNEATKTKTTLGATYAADPQSGRLIKFLKRQRRFSFGSDNGAYHTRPTSKF